LDSSCAPPDVTHEPAPKAEYLRRVDRARSFEYLQTADQWRVPSRAKFHSADVCFLDCRSIRFSYILLRGPASTFGRKYTHRPLFFFLRGFERYRKKENVFERKRRIIRSTLESLRNRVACQTRHDCTTIYRRDQFFRDPTFFFVRTNRFESRMLKL